MRPLIILLLTVSSILAAGCSGGKPDLARRTATETTSARNAKQEALAQRAVKSALSRSNPDSANAAIYRLWLFMQDGVVPLASALYTSRVIDGLGLPAVQGGLLAQSSFFKSYTPKVRSRESTPVGLLVSVITTAPGRQPVNAAYVLRRRGSGWKIAFDTVLEQGLDAYGRQTTLLGGSDATTKRRALAQGAALAERYRLLTHVPGSRR